VNVAPGRTLELKAQAVVVFEYDYSGSAEFLDPSAGAARRAALEEAGRSLGAIFDHAATIQLKVTSSNDTQSGVLASAISADLDVGDDFFGFSPGVVQHKILTGEDGNGPIEDGEVDVNFGEPWDLDDDVSAEAFDFKATMVHELMHAVGFTSLIFEDGTDVFETQPGGSGVWSPFDQFLTGPDGVSIIDENFALDGSAWNARSVGGASPENGLFFNGPNRTRGQWRSAGGTLLADGMGRGQQREPSRRRQSRLGGHGNAGADGPRPLHA